MASTGIGEDRRGEGGRRGEERTVRRSFWRKARRTVGRVPFLDEALAALLLARSMRARRPTSRRCCSGRWPISWCPPT